MTEREVIAHHEASHAVAAAVLGVPFDYVEVFDRPQEAERLGPEYLSTGTMRFHEAPSSWGRALRRRAAVVALAGAWGEAFVRRSGCDWSRSDRRMAEEYVADHGDTTLVQLSIEARGLIERHWQAVHSVARGLLRFNRLSADDVAQIATR